MKIDQHIIEKAAKIKVIICDIDGVMTDGRIIYDDFGDEAKFFNVHDGLGLMLLKRAKIKRVIMTAKKSKVVRHRANELKIDQVFLGGLDKLKNFGKVLKKFRVKPEEVCFIGDDIIDLPVLTRVGLAVSVPNGLDYVKDVAHYVTLKPGGHGAVREVCDILLKAQNKWDEVTKLFRS